MASPRISWLKFSIRVHRTEARGAAWAPWHRVPIHRSIGCRRPREKQPRRKNHAARTALLPSCLHSAHHSPGETRMDRL